MEQKAGDRNLGILVVGLGLILLARPIGGAMVRLAIDPAEVQRLEVELQRSQWEIERLRKVEREYEVFKQGVVSSN